jgi:hypothetical protein
MLTKSQLESALNHTIVRPDLQGAWLILCEDAGFLTALSFCKAEHPRLKIGLLGAFSEWPSDLPLLPARFMVNPVPGHAIGALSLLEDWGIANRWACADFKPGSVEGDLSALSLDYLRAQADEWDGFIYAGECLPAALRTVFNQLERPCLIL